MGFFFSFVGDRLIAKYDGGNTYFVHPNGLESSQMLTDQGSNVAQDQLYFPWGQPWQNPPPAGVNEDIRFAGMQEMEGWLYPTPNRNMNPTLGRWMTPDPLGNGAVHLDDPQTWNMYAYVRNSPIRFSDPSGLVNWSDVGRGGFEMVGGIIGVAAGVTSAAGTAGLAAVPGIMGANIGAAAFVAGMTNVMGGLTETPGTREAADIVRTQGNMAGQAAFLLSHSTNQAGRATETASTTSTIVSLFSGEPLSTLDGVSIFLDVMGVAVPHFWEGYKQTEEIEMHRHGCPACTGGGGGQNAVQSHEGRGDDLFDALHELLGDFR